jgi:hypothetical protein
MLFEKGIDCWSVSMTALRRIHSFCFPAAAFV